MLVQTTVSGRSVAIPNIVPVRGWQIDRKGYLFWSSRGYRQGIKRGEKCHRVVMKRLGFVLTPDIQVHHQDHDKLNCCPCNLIALPGEFNPSGAKRDPFTGEFMSIEQYRRRYASDYQDSEIPF